MRLNKKGSMELGVNAIVILIIALAILGLGIAFVTNLFRGGTDKLGSIIANTELPIHGDAINPIVFEKEELDIKQGKNVKLKVSVYNDGFAGTPPNNVALSIEGCKDAVGDYADIFLLSAPEQDINPGSDAGYLAIITADDQGNDITGTYTCTIKATADTGTTSKQIIINVVI
ncbi:hypothetical protein JW711_03045 [Candidatus Woesearchaeota archaeon]|nr:hypothetical protein [Candidatus Woesearchaeota archaeon]